MPKSWTPFQWAPFDGVPALERKLAYLKAVPALRGAKISGTSRARPRSSACCRGATGAPADPACAWMSGVRSTAGRALPHDLWMQAFASTGIRRRRIFAPTFSRGPAVGRPGRVDQEAWLQIELIKARRRCAPRLQVGACYACGVPGNGEDTYWHVDAGAGALRAFDAATAPAATPRLPRGRQRRRVPQKAMPDLPAPPARGRRPAAPVFATASLSPRRATRASSRTAIHGRLTRHRRGSAARYRGFIPHEALDGPRSPSASRAGTKFRRRGHRSVRPGSGTADRREASRRNLDPRRARCPPEPTLAKAFKGARYTVRLESGAGEPGERRSGAGWREAMPPCAPFRWIRRFGSEPALEVKLDQRPGETATPGRCSRRFWPSRRRPRRAIGRPRATLLG